VLSWWVYWFKVPPGHELVRLWHSIDWVAINRWAAPVYHNARGGRPAWAPAQLLAMLTLMFLYGVAHETTLVARLQENIVWCWFCGFGLFGPFPTHDALYEFRQRLGAEEFEHLLTLTVQACMGAGLVANTLVHFDLTAVAAAAHRWSPYERAVILSRALLRYLELVWAEQQPEQPFPEALRQLASEVAMECLGHKGLKEVQPERVLESVTQWEQAAERREPAWRSVSEAVVAELQITESFPPLPAELGRGQQMRAWMKRVAQQILQHMSHARGDMDARVGRTSRYTFFCGYLLGFVVDGAHQVITAVTWAVGNVKQYKLLQPALEAHCQRVGRPQAVAVHCYLDQVGVEGHITSRAHTPPRDGGYGTDRVTWDPDTHQLRCPSGAALRLSSQSQDGTQVLFGTACAQCDLYVKCYPRGEGQPKRFGLNSVVHRRWQENRAHCQTPAYKAAQRQRFSTEGRFGLTKMNHRRDKAPYRSAAMNHIAALMLAVVMNLRLLAR
jgi:transposase